MTHGNSRDACACVCQKSFGGTRHSEATRMLLTFLSSEVLAAKHIKTDYLHRVAAFDRFHLGEFVKLLI